MPEILTFGCRLNTLESEAIQTLAAHLPTTTIVNTCAVTLEAERQARQAIARIHRERPGTPIIVTGCAAQIDPARWAALPGVTQILGNQEKIDPASYRTTASAVAPIAQARHHAPHPSPMPVDGLANRARAFLDIQQGCDHACTFCIIPQGRGPNRSVPPDLIIQQLRRLTAAGINEVVLTGVDLASYQPSLAHLLQTILRQVPELPRLRLSSLDPAALDAAFWHVLATEPRLMPHLHLSLQAGSTLILKRMRRRHTRQTALATIAQARRTRPGLAIAADLIAGFPTETEALFAETLAFIGEAQIPYLHVFPYSARPGTPAARMPQLPQPLRRERAARLRTAATPHAEAFHQAMLGTTQHLVVERNNRAHTETFAPALLTTPAPIGSIVARTVTATTASGLEVE